MQTFSGAYLYFFTIVCLGAWGLGALRISAAWWLLGASLTYFAAWTGAWASLVSMVTEI